MKCINEKCPHGELTEKDFYYSVRANKTLKNRKCKHCILDEEREKNRIKKQEREFSYGY